jgi:hypothetical protein
MSLSTFREMKLRHLLLPLRIGLFLLWLGAPTWLHSETLSGTVEDQSGAVIVGARIEISGADLGNPVALLSDGQGKFSFSDLKPGIYSVQVTRDGFESLVKAVDLRGSVQLRLQLVIAQRREQIAVSGKNLAFANSDPAYRMLRGIGRDTFRFDNFTLSLIPRPSVWKGTLTMLSPVNGIATAPIFSGEGHFNPKPVLCWMQTS